MHDCVRDCAERSVGHAGAPLRTRAYAIPCGLPATAWYFRTDVAPPPRRSRATFLEPQNDLPANADAPASLRQIRCRVFEIGKIRAPLPQRRVAEKFARYPCD